MKDKNGKELIIGNAVTTYLGTDDKFNAIIINYYQTSPGIHKVVLRSKINPSFTFTRSNYEVELIEDKCSFSLQNIVDSRNDCNCAVCNRSCAKVEIVCWWCGNTLT